MGTVDADAVVFAEDGKLRGTTIGRPAAPVVVIAGATLPKEPKKPGVALVVDGAGGPRAKEKSPKEVVLAVVGDGLFWWTDDRGVSGLGVVVVVVAVVVFVEVGNNVSKGVVVDGGVVCAGSLSGMFGETGLLLSCDDRLDLREPKNKIPLDAEWLDVESSWVWLCRCCWSSAVVTTFSCCCCCCCWFVLLLDRFGLQRSLKGLMDRRLVVVVAEDDAEDNVLELEEDRVELVPTLEVRSGGVRSSSWLDSDISPGFHRMLS